MFFERRVQIHSVRFIQPFESCPELFACLSCGKNAQPSADLTK
jgi:hypothetical protein